MSLMIWAKKRRWLLLFVVFPTILATLYYSMIASGIYISESRFIIKSPDQKGPQISSLASLIETRSLSSGQEQANEILDYVRSRNALTDLTKRYDVKSAFMSPRGDFLSRFPGISYSKTFEGLYKYYGKMVGADLDPQTGTATIRVEAFTPTDAYKINAQLLDLSEAMVNRLNERARTRGISEAEQRVAEAEARLRNAQVAIAKYRNTTDLIDPEQQAAGVLEISNSMVAERAALNSQLIEMRSSTPRNPAIPALRARIASLTAQIEAQNARVTGNHDAIASRLTEYEALSVEQKFATENLAAASAALVEARTSADRQQYYLERVVSPNVPDEALLPRRVWSVITVALATLCLYFVAWMLIAGILEHSPDE